MLWGFGKVRGANRAATIGIAKAFPNASFDLVIEKGTLDALYTGPVQLVSPTIQESFRVLRPGGFLVSISFGNEAKRKDLFRATTWAEWEQTPLKYRHEEEPSSAAEASSSSGKLTKRSDKAAFYVYKLRKPRPGEEGLTEKTSSSRSTLPVKG